MISYDIGAENIKPVHTVRFVTKLLAITTMTVYMTEDEEPLTEEELFKVDLTMRTALAFISRNRLQVMAEELAFFDDMGFRNIRTFFRFLAWNSKPGDFNGMAAIQYNLRHFALVNEEYGRSGGDMVLKNHYKYIENLIGKGCMVSRLGGDTFVCVCRQTDLPELLEYLDDAVVLANPNGKTVNISAYAGVFKIPDGYTVGNPNDIMGKIIQAYQIAQAGENGHIVFCLMLLRTMNSMCSISRRSTLIREKYAVRRHFADGSMTDRLCRRWSLSRSLREQARYARSISICLIRYAVICVNGLTPERKPVEYR